MALIRPIVRPLVRDVTRAVWGLRAGRAASGPPTANMAAWFRKGTGITSASSAVSGWADQSGNGRDLLQATGANQPDEQGDGTILFNGSSDFLKCAAFTFAQPCTIYLRMKQVTWTSADRIFDGNALNSGVLYQHFTTPNVRQHAGSDATENGAMAVNTWASVAAVFNAASSVLQINATTVTGNPSTNNMGGFTLGAAADATGFGHIQVAEGILYDAAHDATQRAAVIAYLDTL